MAALVDDILDLARGRLGDGIPVVRQDAALEAPLREVVEELRSAHPTRPSRRAIDLPRAGPPRPAPDRAIALQPAGQRAGAWRGGPPGAGDRPRRGKAALTLAVANAGPPIRPEVMARLFQPFSREVDGTRAGLGLGLYIAAEVARVHGGTLGVASDEAATVFTLELPRDAPAG